MNLVRVDKQSMQLIGSRSPQAALYPLVVAALLMIVFVLLVLHVGLGRVALAPGEVLAALIGNPTDPLHRQIVWDLRLPRALIGLLVGAMLGLAGAILQSITRNPLAEPGLTGVSAGAVLLAVLWIVFGPGADGTAAGLPFVALLGGLAAGGLTYVLSWQGRSDPLRLVLVGVLVSAVLGSATSLLLIRSSSIIGNILLWLVGSLNGRVWVHWDVLWPWALVGLPLGLLATGLANALHLGDDVAAGIGLRVEWSRGALLFIATMLVAGAVSVAGAIGFIGLIGPHIARRLVGSDARRLYPTSALLAAALLLASDAVAQAVVLELPIAAGVQRVGLPVGAVTALLGAPFFLYLLRRKTV